MDTTVFDVAGTIIVEANKKQYYLDVAKLEYLLYYAQGVFLGMYKKTLFPEYMFLEEPWVRIYIAELRGKERFIPAMQIYENVGEQWIENELSYQQLEIINYVIDTFAPYSVIQLRSQITNELPIENARNRIVSNAIARNDLQAFFECENQIHQK